MPQPQTVPPVAEEAAGAIELSVLIPVCNEEESIAPLFEKICDALKDLGKPWELIIVDDGSTDATVANVRKEFARPGLDLRIIEFQRNFGKAAGLQAGIDAARGRLLVTLDGDLQNDPYDIPKMIAVLEERDLDLLCGWRKERNDGLMLRLIPSWIANRLIRKMTGVTIHDYGCGLKLYRTSVLRQIRILGGMHRFIPAWIARVVPTSRIGEMVVNHYARQFGESKYGISRTFRVFLDLLTVVFFMRFSQRPGHFFGSIGLIFGVISALMFLILLWSKFIFGQDIGTRPMLMVAVMLFVASAQMITTGVLAEMLLRTGGEVTNYVIRKATDGTTEVIDRLARNGGAVYLLLAAYFIVNIAVRLAQPQSLELDEGQQLFLAQWLALGYDNQPPLYNWLQYWVVQVFGDTMLSLTLLKNTMLFVSYVFFGLAAHLVIRDRVLAIVATLGLITIPQVGYEAQRDLTHTVAVFFASCMFLYFFLRSLAKPSAASYALTGVAIGVGILSKYNFILLPLSAVLALLLDRGLRNRLFDIRILLTAAAAAVVVAPHSIWFFEHMSFATAKTMDKMTRGDGAGSVDHIAIGVLSLFTAVVAITLPTLIVYAIGFGRTLLTAFRSHSQWTRLLERIMLISVMLLLLLVVFGGASYIRHRWILPFFFLFPLYLGAKIDASGEQFPGAARRFGTVIAALMIFIPSLLFLRPVVGGVLGDYGKQNVPYGPAIAEILATNPDRPSIILAPTHQMSGNVRLHAPGIPVAMPGYEALEPNFAFDATHPILAIWHSPKDGKPESELSADMAKWINGKLEPDQVLDVRQVAVPYIYSREGDVHHFAYAWIYPPAGAQP